MDQLLVFHLQLLLTILELGLQLLQLSLLLLHPVFSLFAFVLLRHQCHRYLIAGRHLLAELVFFLLFLDAQFFFGHVDFWVEVSGETLCLAAALALCLLGI